MIRRFVGDQHRQQQHVSPHDHAAQQAAQQCARTQPGSVDGQNDRRRQLRQAGKRDHADIGQRLGAAGQATVGVSQQHHQHDPQPSLNPHRYAHFAGRQAAPIQHQRRQPMVADHDRQRQARQDHHAGGRAQATEKGEQGQRRIAFGKRQHQHIQIRRHALPAQQRFPGARQRQRRQPDQNQKQRKQPARGADMRAVAALDHADVELVRQGKHGQRPKQHQRDERAHRTERLAGRGRGPVAGPVVQPEQHEQHQRQHGAQLEQRLEAHGQYQAAVVLHGRGAPGAEQYREQRHEHGDVKRQILPGRQPVAIAGHPGQRAEAHGHGLQLKRDVGHDPEYRDGGHHRRQHRRLAEAAGDEVGDAGGVVLLAQLDQAHQKTPAEQIDQDGADEGGRHRPTRTGRLRGRAVERPGRAVDGQRKRVDHRPVAAKPLRGALAGQRGRKQQPQPDQSCDRQDAAGYLDHGWQSACFIMASLPAKRNGPAITPARTKGCARQKNNQNMTRAVNE